ncbi:MAG TPA: outer membrane protein [Pseudolabrys sp.]|jgi:outer membrane immunogenic protein
MRKFAVAVAAIAAFGFVSSASAADMPTKTPMVAPIQVWNWTGFYIGINGGGGWARSTQTDTAGATSGSYNQSGGLVGGTVGYNWQMTNWVLGLEADWDWAHINGSTSVVGCAAPGCFTNLRSIGTVRPRLGYAWDRWMIYATGGFAWGDIKTGQDSCPATPTLCGNHTEAGWTVGGGVEAFVIPKWTVKVEYLYADFGNHVYYTPAIPVSATEKVNIVRAGLNYHF